MRCFVLRTYFSFLDAVIISRTPLFWRVVQNGKLSASTVVAHELWVYMCKENIMKIIHLFRVLSVFIRINI